jgi:sugar lactone lactonase YvrE
MPIRGSAPPRSARTAPGWSLTKQTDRVFADLTCSEPGGPDGMKVDATGNVYCGGAGGI